MLKNNLDFLRLILPVTFCKELFDLMGDSKSVFVWKKTEEGYEPCTRYEVENVPEQIEFLPAYLTDELLRMLPGFTAIRKGTLNEESKALVFSCYIDRDPQSIGHYGAGINPVLSIAIANFLIDNIKAGRIKGRKIAEAAANAG